MRLVGVYVRALGRSYTFNPRRNPYLWFGLAWGVPVPILSFALDLWLGAPGRGPLDVLRDHPAQFLLLLHPLLFAVVFGAMGTLRHDLESENARLIRELRELATTDALTGMANRRRVLEELESALARSSRNRESFSVVMLDLDGFKRINDEQGHLVGDLILKRTAAALRSVVRQGDVLGRYGGDEFLLVASGVIATKDPFLDRAKEAVRSASGLSISAGVAHYPKDGGTATGLIETADDRLYELKRAAKVRRRSSA